PAHALPHPLSLHDALPIFCTGVSIGVDRSMEDIQRSYDAVYIAIGAHTDKKLGLEGEDSQNVVSAVELLRDIGEGRGPDFTGKRSEEHTSELQSRFDLVCR